MQDLVVLELVIAAVTALSLLRPFIKQFRGVDGIVFLPFLALAGTASLFPAFGFRPEVLPLLAFEFLFSLLNIPRFFDVLRNLQNDDYREVPFARVALGIVLLIASASFAIANVPSAPMKAAGVSPNEWVVKDNKRGCELYLRDYASTASTLVVVIPPSLGSRDSVDHYCRALNRSGYHCISFSRPGFDSPAVTPGTGKRIYPPFFGMLHRSWLGLFGNTVEARARAEAALESERLADLRFLVPFLREAIASGNPTFATVDPARIVLAGFAEGGSAAASYAAETPGPLAVISIEGIFSSCFVLQDGAPKSGNWWQDHVRGGLERLSLLPVVGVSKPAMPSIPCLFILSDRIRDPDWRDSRYAADLRALRTAASPCAIVSVDGAGRWDYTEIAREYPVYPAHTKGALAQNRAAAWYPEKAAELTGRFLSMGATGFKSGALDGPLVSAEYNKLWN